MPLSVCPSDSPQEQAVRTVYRELLRSWNRRDARSFAALFSEHGRLVGVDGSEACGRLAIELELPQMFARVGNRPCVGIVREVQMLTGEVALVAAVAGVYPSGGYRVDPSDNMLQTLVVARERSRWRVRSYQCTRASFRERPELAHKLTLDLERALVRNAAATTRS